MDTRNYILTVLVLLGTVFVAKCESEKLENGHRCSRSPEKVLARFSKDRMLHVRKRRGTVEETSQEFLDAIDAIEGIQRSLKESDSGTDENYELEEELFERLEEFCEWVGYKAIPDEESCGKYRSMNGVCNNIDNPNWGRAGYPYQRLLLARYKDGVSQPRWYRSTAREVSQAFAKNGEGEWSTYGASELVMHFGQFLDHDINLTPAANAQCECGDDVIDTSLCYSIPCSWENDDLCGNGGCIKFRRSRPTIAGDCQPGPRTHENAITSFVDASNVYGSSLFDAEALHDKAKGRGQMKVDVQVIDEEHIHLLPPDRENEECVAIGDEHHCGRGGDVRAAEQPGLTSLHTIFVREHNRVAWMLHAINQRWDDERLFEEARRIVIAVMQKIVYGEFLPIVLGRETMDKYKLGLWNRYEGYNKKINPTLFNEVAAAFMRFGHSLIPDVLHRVASLHEGEHHPKIELRSAFFNASHMYEMEYGSVSSLLLGMIDTPALPVDRFFTPAITKHLFENAADGTPGLDLIALNIQRARDHGLPPYVAYRRSCELSVPKSWDDLTEDNIMSAETVEDLKKVYGSVQEIDVFVGYISERPKEGALVGETAACILGKQFHNLKYGDRYWFENTRGEQAFTDDQLEAIQKVTLARLICENIRVESIQPAVFKVPEKTTHDDDNQNGKDFERYFYKLILNGGYPNENGELNSFKNRLVECNNFDAIPELSLIAWSEECKKFKDDSEGSDSSSRGFRRRSSYSRNSDSDSDSHSDSHSDSDSDSDDDSTSRSSSRRRTRQYRRRSSS